MKNSFRAILVRAVVWRTVLGYEVFGIARFVLFGALAGLSTVPMTRPQAGTPSAARTPLGRLTNGAEVVFVRSGSGAWETEISGGSVQPLAQEKPAQVGIGDKKNRTAVRCQIYSIHFAA